MPNKVKFPVKYKQIGWVGFVSNKPDFEKTTDDYTGLDEPGTPAVNIYKIKKEAKKRYCDIREVFIRQ